MRGIPRRNSRNFEKSREKTRDQQHDRTTFSTSTCVIMLQFEIVGVRLNALDSMLNLHFSHKAYMRGCIYSQHVQKNSAALRAYEVRESDILRADSFGPVSGWSAILFSMLISSWYERGVKGLYSYFAEVRSAGVGGNGVEEQFSDPASEGRGRRLAGNKKVR